MEELTDDDCGDLYVDVEIQASSAINSISNFTQPEIQEHEDTNNNNITKQVNHTEKEENFASASKQLTSNGENLEADGSDSEDDLNIVLNEDYCKGFPDSTTRNGSGGGGYDKEKEENGDNDCFTGAKNGSGKNGLDLSANCYGGERGNGVKCGYNSQYLQFKHVRPYRSSFPSNKKGNDYVGLASTSARVDWEDNRCKQDKVFNSGFVANIRATANSVLSHGGYGFSLPRYRTILDVNIDAFVEKRWRYPGVDISDFFNFGFNEDSWRQYCISLEQFRQQSNIHGMLPIHPKCSQAYELGSEHNGIEQEATIEHTTEVGVSSKFAGSEERRLGLPKGRAIQVEHSTGERQPTMDVSTMGLRHPSIWDSDVVIKINVQDTEENTVVIGEEELGNMDNTGQEGSNSRDLKVDGMRDSHYSSRASEDELSAQSLLGNIRSPQPNLECNQKSVDPDTHENEKIFYANEYDHQKVNAQTSDDTVEAMGTVEKAEKEICKNTCQTDQSLIETELSLSDHSYFSRTLSCSESDSEAAQDNGYGVPEESPSHLRRRSSGTELQESFVSEHEIPKRISIAKRPGSNRNYSRNKSLSSAGQKHHIGRFCRVSNRTVHLDSDYDASPISRDRPSVDCGRQIRRLHDFEYNNEEDLLYYRHRDLTCGSGERFFDNHMEAVYPKHSHKRYHQSFTDEIKPHEKRIRKEKYCCERSLGLDSQDSTHRDSYKWGRGLSPEDMICLTYKPRRLGSKYDNFKESNFRSRSDKIRYGKRTNHDNLHNYKNLDDLIQEKYGRSVPFSNRKRDFMEERCERHGPHREGEMSPFGRSGRYGAGPIMNFDSLCCVEMEKHQISGQQHPFCHSHHESYEVNNGSWRDMMSPRYKLFGSRLAEKYRRHRRQSCDEEGSDDDWVSNRTANNEDGIIYPDDGRRKYSWQSRVVHCTKDESILMCQDDEFYAERTSCSYGVTARHERVHAKFRPPNSGMVADDMQWEPHRYKIINEGNGTNFVNRNPNGMHRKHEQMVRRCSDPVDLIFGEGKVKLGQPRSNPCITVLFSGRSFNSGSLMLNGKVDEMGLRFAKVKTISEDCKESETGKAMQTDVPKIVSDKDNEKWLDKHPVTEHDKDLDIEDGQIVPELNIEDNLVLKRGSQSAVSTANLKKGTCRTNDASGRNEVNGTYDDQRILDTLARMEKRRERFKDPITLIKGSDKSPKPQDDLTVDIAESKQTRPARKRRWCGR